MSNRFVGPLAAAGLAAALLSSPAALGQVISEIRTGQPGPDLSEYFEIKGVPGTVLNDVWYLVVGDDDSQFPPLQNGYIEVAINLTGVMIPPSGYLVVAEGTFALGTADVVTNLNFEDNANTTHFLVTGFTGFPGTDIDSNNDGTADGDTPWNGVLSSIALWDGNPPNGVTNNYIYSGNTVGPDDVSVPSHVYRCENGSDYQVASGDPTAGEDTAGAANPRCAGAAIQISEIRVDQVGSDNDEYFEISGPPGASLAGHTYIVIGDGTGGSGVIEAVIDLSALTIPADGILFVAEPTFTLDAAIPDFTTAGNGLNFENSDNVTHMLVTDFTGTNDQDLDTNDDGTLDVTPWTTIVDSLGLVESPTIPPTGTVYVYGPNLIGPDGGFSPSHVYRCSPSGAWTLGLFDPAQSVDSPGTENFSCASCGGAGNCFVEHLSPGCDLLDCCALVCAVDPSCCSANWDSDCVALATSTCTARGAAPVLTLNEVRIGHEGADTNEYVEIVGTPGTSLAGVSYVVIGDGVDPNGVVESVSLLSGTIPIDGYFVVAKSTFSLGVPDLVRNSINFEDGDTVTHFLVFNFTGSMLDDLDADNNCVLDSTPWQSTIASLTLTNGDPGLCGYSPTVVGPDDVFSPGHAYTCTPDGTWTVGQFGSFVNDTPGAANAACAEPDPCANPKAQDCFTQARTPGCSDSDCCNAVCLIDPTCCDAAWDRSCVAQAVTTCFVPREAPEVSLSEIRADQVNNDNDEYLELMGDAGTSLNGLTYIVIGDGAAALGSGVIEMALPLQGQTIPDDGFFLATESTFTLTGATPDFIPTGVNPINFENGDNVTHMIVFKFTGAAGDDLDTNDDGVLDSTPWESVVQSVGLVVDPNVPPRGTEYVYSSTIVGPDDVFVPSHVKFCPSTGTWTLGEFDPALGDDTPGAANGDCRYGAPCPADLDGTGSVDASDLAILLGAWGATNLPPADIDQSGGVDASDLAILLGAWGPCP